jgi:hypothetical protein
MSCSGHADCIARAGSDLSQEHQVQTDDLTTITERVPRFIDAKGHAVLDYLTAGTFFALGFAMLGRHSRAAGLAFANGASVLAVSLLTDYPGGVFRTLSFKTHRTMDIIQAGMSAAGPALLGFAGDPEAQAFHGQALLESGVIAATNWDAVPAH